MRSLLILLCCLPLIGLSQPYSFGFQQEYFFGNLPHARNEALGRAGVALHGSTANIFQNPASISSVQGWDATIGTSGPFYVLRESDYYFAGVSRRIHPKVVVAASIHQFAIGPTTFDINFGPARYPADAPKTTNTALSVAGEVLPGLQTGVNLNVFRWTYLDEIAPVHKLHADAGVLYTVALPENAKGGTQQIVVGASVNNFLGSDITFFGPNDETATQPFPIVLRLGGTYTTRSEISIPGAGTGPLQWLITTEFQDVLNNDFRTALKIGTEVLVWDIFAFRIGTYTRSTDNLGNPTANRSRINDVTYGFGFQVPLRDLTNESIPCDLTVDYTSLEPAPVRFSGTRVPNLRTFTFGFTWPVDE